jgi:hypothetical protein
LLVKVQNRVEVAVTEKDATLNLEVQFVGVFFDLCQKLRGKGLGAELFDEAFVVYFAFNFPWGDDHFVVFAVCRRHVWVPFLQQEGVSPISLFYPEKLKRRFG